MGTVLFDLAACQPIRDSRFHGGGVYGGIVFKALVNVAPERIVAYYKPSQFLDENVQQLLKDKNIIIANGDAISYSEAYHKYNCSKFYSPLYSIQHDQLIAEGVPVILTIHGLRPLEMFTDSDEVSYATKWRDKLKAIVKSSPLCVYQKRKYYARFEYLLSAENVQVVTVSYHSKYSMKSYYPNSEINRIHVFYSPSTAMTGYEEFIGTKTDVKYYMIISANRWLKNAGRAMLALDKIFDTNPDLCDCVKVLGLKTDTNVYKRIRNKNKFEILGYQPQEDLEKLYSGAYALIYPTLNEGFGYPPLEAMKYGVPVVSSPFSSIPEVCGDSVLYANPYSIEEIDNRILQLEDSSVYEKMKTKSLLRYMEIKEKQDSDLIDLCDLILCEHKLLNK